MNAKRRKNQNFAVEIVPIDSVFPSPENDDIYNGVNHNRDDFKDLVKSVRQSGIKEALHVTQDDYILSGHRRHAAACKVKLTEVPIIRQPFTRSEMTKSKYRKLLAEYNCQRDKTSGEKLKEKLARTNTKKHTQLIAEKLEHLNKDNALEITTSGVMDRHGISKDKQEFLAAVMEDVMSRRGEWPISQRSIHYNLIEKRPKILRNSSTGKKRRTYDNDRNSSNKLSDLVTEARVLNLIPPEAIHDETRAQTVWDTHDDVTAYVNSVSQWLAFRYQRDLQAGQPFHIELVIEKLTIHRPCKEVAIRYTIPVTVARGMASYPPRQDVVRRWKESGKDKLAVVVFSDLDPAGIVIADIWHKSLVSDLGVDPNDLKVIRGGLTAEQAERFSLPKSIDAVDPDFTAKYGTHQHELDALKVTQLKELVTEAIESVLDREAYEIQVENEENEGRFLEVAAQQIGEFIADLMDEYDAI